MSYAPYPSYKDSGVPWLGQVPEGWEVKRLRYASKLADERLPYDKVHRPYVGLENIESWTGKRIVDDEARADGIVALFERGDVLFGKLRPYLAKVHRADETGCSSTEALILRGKSGLDTRFLKYFMLSPAFIDEVNATTYGAKMPRANWSDVGALPVSLPPIEEQAAIADFLDKKTAEIDDLIAKKEELLHLLAEQRTALITHAVTKGLDPTAPMKPNGIEWLGDVPEGWEVKPLKFLGRFQNGISIGGDSFGSGFPFVSYGDVYKNLRLPERGSGLVESTAKDRILYSVECGDIFFTRTSETIEEIAISSVCETTIPDAVFAGFLIRCRPYPRRLNVGFAKYYFRNSRLRDYFVKEMNLVTRASLGQTLLGNLMVALPPLDEQDRISEFLDEKLEALEKSKADGRKSIRLLKEYRTALITNAVTGKIKVA